MLKTSPWVIAAPTSALGRLAPLLAARAARQPLCILADGVGALLADPAAHLPPEAEAVLIVGPRPRAPRRMLPGLWLHDAAGRAVPVGWLPDAGRRLATYAAAAARVLERCGPAGPLVVLGQWEDRFLRVALRTVRWFRKHAPADPVFHWTADRLSRTDLLAGLAAGPGLALYFGHGRPRGWAGYHGVRAGHFAEPWPEPLGALLAICCENASRWRTSPSFAEELALRGVFAGALAATGKTLHEDNRRIGPALCEAHTDGSARTLCELVARAGLPEGFWTRTPYRFIGDPAAPLTGAAEAARHAARVFAPAPDEALPPWPEEAGVEQTEELSVTG
jgi:hypothetical protein